MDTMVDIDDGGGYDDDDGGWTERAELDDIAEVI
jgi:hypothetical protein